MITFSWWAAIIIVMSIYWPITLIVAGTIVMTAFLGTKSVGWRTAGTVLATLLVAPVVWFYALT